RAPRYVAVEATGEVLKIRNLTGEEIGYSVLEENVVFIAIIPPCSSPDACPTLKPHQTVEVRYEQITGYHEGSEAAVVNAWNYVPDRQYGTRVGRLTQTRVELYAGGPRQAGHGTYGREPRERAGPGGAQRPAGRGGSGNGRGDHWTRHLYPGRAGAARAGTRRRDERPAGLDRRAREAGRRRRVRGDRAPLLPALPPLRPQHAGRCGGRGGRGAGGVSARARGVAALHRVRPV